MLKVELRLYRLFRAFRPLSYKYIEISLGSAQKVMHLFEPSLFFTFVAFWRVAGAGNAKTRELVWWLRRFEFAFENI